MGLGGDHLPHKDQTMANIYGVGSSHVISEDKIKYQNLDGSYN